MVELPLILAMGASSEKVHLSRPFSGANARV